MNKKAVLILFIFIINISFANPDPHLPVELVYFNGKIENNYVLLSFGTATENNNYGFNIERADPSKNWEKIGFVEGHGNSNIPVDYTYVDSTVDSNGTYFYRLKQIDNIGDFKYSDEINVTVNYITSVEDEIILNDFKLFQNYPNPFNPATKIRFRIASSGFVTLKVFDTNGKEVATLINKELRPGDYEVPFSLNSFPFMSSGIYFYKLEAGQYMDTKKFILLK